MTSTAVIRDKATTNRPQRIGNRRTVRVPGRLTWRDSSGTLRFVSVTTRNVSDLDAFVECDRPASIPLYRLVHFQVEAHARNASLPDALQRGKVLSAVYRGPYQSATGTPQGYALRLLVEPTRGAVEAREPPSLISPSSLSLGWSVPSPGSVVRTTDPGRTTDLDGPSTKHQGLRTFPPIPRQPQPQQLKRGGNGIRGDLRLVHLPPHILPEPVRGPAPLVRARIVERVAYPPRHFLQVLPERLEVRPDKPDGAEVCEKIVSGDQVSIASRLARHFSTSMSGGGVGGRT